MTKKTENKPETKTTKKPEAKPEVINSLKVEVNFPNIVDLKQALAFDADNNLLIKIQFTARVDQFEIFRLVNLLKQPHGSLFATIGSPQSAMDFKFTKDGKIEILKAQIAAEKAKTPTLDTPPEPGPKAAKITEVRFNHIPEEKLPFGVLIEYVADGTGELKTVAGRGKSATEAVIAGVRNCGVVAADVKEPFEVRAALEDLNHLEPSAECFKLLRVLDVGSFDLGEAREGETEKGE